MRLCAKLFQLCLTLCNPVDHSPSGLSVNGILQERILEWGSELLCPPPGDLPNPGRETSSLMSPSLASGFFIASARGKPMDEVSMNK